MIDAHQDVRWGLDGLLMVGDIIAALNTGRAGGRVIRSRRSTVAGAGRRTEGWIRLRQSGDPADAKMRLDDVALDLPAVVEAGAGRRSGLSVTSSNAVMPYSHRYNQIEWVRPVVVVGESEEWVIQGPYMQQASDGWLSRARR